MKKGMTVILAAFLLVFAFSGSSQALINGSIWYYADSEAQNPAAGPPGYTAEATFTVEQLNFVANSATTYENFLSGGAANPNGFAWVTNALPSPDIHTSGGQGSFFQFVWTQYVQNGQLVTVTHDDGFSLQIGSVMYDYGTPTVPITNSFSVTNPDGFYTFTLNYGAWNGYPEVLQAKVPEPMTLLLLGLGMLGIAGIRRK